MTQMTDFRVLRSQIVHFLFDGDSSPKCFRATIEQCTKLLEYQVFKHKFFRGRRCRVAIPRDAFSQGPTVGDSKVLVRKTLRFGSGPKKGSPKNIQVWTTVNET